jgi:hypothetical protein
LVVLEVVDVARCGPRIPGVVFGSSDTELKLARPVVADIELYALVLRVLAVEEVLRRGGLHAEEVIVRGLVAGNRDLHVAGIDQDATVGGDGVSFGSPAALRTEHGKSYGEHDRDDTDPSRPEYGRTKAVRQPKLH